MLLELRWVTISAHPDFRERGLAALRRSEDGHIVFDRGVAAPPNQKIRVQIQQHGQTISTTHVQNTELIGQPCIERQLLDARNSLYDEELHHEIHREARGMTSHGVKCIGNAVILPHDNDMHIVIDIVPLSDEGLEKSGEDDSVHWVTLALRLLLSHAHRQSLRRRSQVPAALTERRVTRPTYSILHPILQFFQHREVVQSSLRDLVIRWGANLESGMDDGTTKSKLSDSLLDRVEAPFRSSFTLRLPSSASVSVLVETCLTAPTFGTIYWLSWDDRSDIWTQFSSLEELEDYVLYALKEYSKV